MEKLLKVKGGALQLMVTRFNTSLATLLASIQVSQNLCIMHLRDAPNKRTGDCGNVSSSVQPKPWDGLIYQPFTFSNLLVTSKEYAHLTTTTPRPADLFPIISTALGAVI